MVKLVVAIVLALVAVLTPVGHAAVDCPTAPRSGSSHSQGHDPVEQEPKKDDLPRKTVENKEALRYAAPRLAAQARASLSWPRIAPPSPVLDDVSRVEHLHRLARPAVLQVFRN